MPVRRSAMDSPELKNFLKDSPQFQGIYDQLENAVYEPQIPAWFKARPELKGFLEKAMRDTESPKKAIDGAAEKFNQILADEQFVKKL
ncbi:hypothetical protein MASR2M64_15130 [Candidatus Cloacimonadota bacterium]